MKLGELKKSLSRFPPDMDNIDVLVQFVGPDGKEDADCLAYIGYVTFRDTAAICFGTWKALDARIKEGKTPPPDDYRIHPDNE